MATRTEFDRDRQDGLPDDRPRKRSHPLFWLLILVALFALGWSYYNHHAGESMPAPVRQDATPATQPPQGPPQGQPPASG